MGWPCTRPTRTSPGSASWPGRTRSTDRSGWRGCVRPERLAAMGGRLDELDLGLGLSREEEAKRLSRAQLRLVYLRLVLGGLMGDEPRIGPPVCIVFEGWDASGTGGCIKRLVAPMHPRHVRVAQFAAPTYDEKRHHFLWRFWPALPGWGGMAVLDRSWYGRVLVERVEGFATKEQWPAYLAAVEEMLARTDTGVAPWTLVEGDSKRWARVKVLDTVISAIEDGMTARGFRVPPQPPGLGKRARRW